MASTFSTNLAIELIGTGDQAGTWGVTTNTNLGTLVEQAISGYVTQAVSTGADTTITIPNGATGVARNMYIELTGTGGTNTNLIVPSNKKLYFIFNNTASGQVTVKVSGQTGVSVPNGKKVVLVCNGTDIVNGLNYIADFGTNSFTVTNLTATSATITNLIATTASISDASATVLRSASATITNLIATSASITTLTNNPTFSAGTANGVLYLNGSKVATSGSGFTYDGTSALISGGNFRINRATNTSVLTLGGSPTDNWEGEIQFVTSNSAVNWRLASNRTTGGAFTITPSTAAGGSTFTTPAITVDNASNLGIGTASPTNYGATYKTLAVNGSSTGIVDVMQNGTVYGQLSTEANVYKVEAVGASTVLRLVTNSATRATLDTSGNLGLGVTPSAWSIRALQVGSGFAAWSSGGTNARIFANTYYDGAYKYVGNGRATQYEQDGYHAWYLAANNTSGAGAAIPTWTQAMTLDASGNLGVGTTSPASGFRLDLQDTTARLRLQSTTGTNACHIQNNNTGGQLLLGIDNSAGSSLFGVAAYAAGLWYTGNYPLVFGTNNTERGRFTAGGDLLVGITGNEDPSSAVVRAGLFSGQRSASASTVFQAWNQATTGDNIFVQFYTEGGGGTLRGSIDYNRAGGLVRYNTTSDYRAKDVYGLLDDSGETIDALKVYRGKMHGATMERPMLIAHEAQEIAPYAVTGEKDAVNDDGTPKFQQMDTSSLVPLLIAEIQSLRSRVSALEAK